MATRMTTAPAVTAGERRAALASLLSRHHHHPGWLPPSPVHPRSNRGSQSGRGISRGRCGYGELKERVPGPGKSQQFQHSDFQSHRYKLAPWQRTQTNRGDTLRWAAANERRAASADGEEFKTVLLGVAAEYRDLALQI